LYNILELRVIQGKKIREIAYQLAMSESDLYRKQRVAIQEVAKTLASMEERGEDPIGVATSSGRFSHALSFGDAEAATVFCENAGLADAVATTVGNVVKGENHQNAIQKGIDKALSIQGVHGVMILYRGFVGTAGKIPQIIKVKPSLV
jgi:ApbE superfamily uncharacterized protein (UPF0280 family)